MTGSSRRASPPHVRRAENLNPDTWQATHGKQAKQNQTFVCGVCTISIRYGPVGVFATWLSPVGEQANHRLAELRTCTQAHGERRLGVLATRPAPLSRAVEAQSHTLVRHTSATVAQAR